MAEITLPDTTATRQKAQTALQAAQGLTIVDNQGFEQAGAMRDALKELSAEIDATFDGPIAAAFKAHKEIVAAKKLHAVPVEEAARVIKTKMIAWSLEQERLRQIEQARLEREAKEKAEAEALQLAEELEKAGLKQEAEQVISEPVQADVVLAPKTTPKVEGFSYRTIYSAEVFYLPGLIAAVAAGAVPQAAILPNQQFLNEQARSLKHELKWPGVKVIERKV